MEVEHLELAAHVGLNMYNCYAIDGLKAALLASSLKCPGFAALVLNLGLPPIPAPKAFDAQVTSSPPPRLLTPRWRRFRRLPPVSSGAGW